MSKFSPRRRWFQFGLGGLFVAVTALALTFWAYPKPTPYEVFGNLSRSDQRAIVAAVRAHPDVRDKRILSIEVTSPTMVEVSTGDVRRPVYGGPAVMYLEKQAGDWKLIRIVSGGVW